MHAFARELEVYYVNPDLSNQEERCQEYTQTHPKAHPTAIKNITAACIKDIVLPRCKPNLDIPLASTSNPALDNRRASGTKKGLLKNRIIKGSTVCYASHDARNSRSGKLWLTKVGNPRHTSSV